MNIIKSKGEEGQNPSLSDIKMKKGEKQRKTYIIIINLL